MQKLTGSNGLSNTLPAQCWLTAYSFCHADYTWVAALSSRVGRQVWVPVMSWYLEQRRQLEQQVKKYSDPPSEHLLPDLPPHARCRHADSACCLSRLPLTRSFAGSPAPSPSSGVLMPDIKEMARLGLTGGGYQTARIKIN